MSVSPSEHLKASTQAVHRRVERTPFVQSFLRGTLSISDYVLHLQALDHVYGTLEACVHRHADLRSFPWRVLARRPALRADLHALGAAPTCELSPASAVYRDRLTAAEAEEPRLLAAHAYVRYLGDLSGGQILARIAQTKLGLPESACHFYRFAEPAEALKARFRQALDELSVDPEKLAAEALLAFELNEALFLEIQPSTKASRAPATATSRPRPAPKSAVLL